MPPVAELAGIVALAVVVVREAFAMVKTIQSRLNGTGNNQVMQTVQGEIMRLRDQMLILSTAVATIQGELIRRGKE